MADNIQCTTRGYEMYGTPEQRGKCSECFADLKEAEAKAEREIAMPTHPGGFPKLMGLAAKAAKAYYFSLGLTHRHIHIPDFASPDHLAAVRSARESPEELIYLQWSRFDSITEGRYPHRAGHGFHACVYPEWITPLLGDPSPDNAAVAANPGLRAYRPDLVCAGVTAGESVMFLAPTTLLKINMADRGFPGAWFTFVFPQILAQMAADEAEESDAINFESPLPCEGRYPDPSTEINLTFGYTMRPGLTQDMTNENSNRCIYAVPPTHEWELSNPHKTFRIPTGHLRVDMVYTVRGAPYIHFRFDDDLQLECWFTFSVPFAQIANPAPATRKRTRSAY